MRSIAYNAALTGMLVALAGCKLQCSAGGVDNQKLAREIGAKLTEMTGVDIQVTCPDIDPDTVTSCTARAASGVSFLVDVQKDEDGDLAWESVNVAIGKKLGAKVQQFYIEQQQVDLGEVTCPPVVLRQDGVRIDCTAKPQGVAVTIEVALQGDNIDANLTSGVVLASAAAELARNTLAKDGITAQVDCGPAVRISVPGSTFTCEATTESGEKMTLYYKITSDNGMVSMQSKPFE